jgi:hypothetical protein
MTDYSKVTISQGLRLAAKLKKQVADLKERAESSVKHKVGEATAFEFTDVYDEVLTRSTDLSNLKGLIAEANAKTKIKWENVDISLATAIAILSEIKGQIAWTKTLATQPVERVKFEVKVWDDNIDKYVISQQEMFCHLPEGVKATTIDLLQEKFDRLNALVEAANQTTFLM